MRVRKDTITTLRKLGRMEVNYVMLDVTYNLGWIDCDGLMLGIVDCGDGIETLSIQVREFR